MDPAGACDLLLGIALGQHGADDGAGFLGVDQNAHRGLAGVLLAAQAGAVGGFRGAAEETAAARFVGPTGAVGDGSAHRASPTQRNGTPPDRDQHRSAAS